MGKAPARYGVHAVVVLLCALTAFPMLWMLSTAIKPPPEVFVPGLRLIPDRPTLQNFPEAFGVFPIASWFANSLYIGALTTLGKLAISLPAAYAFARMRFRGREAIFAM